MNTLRLFIAVVFVLSLLTACSSLKPSKTPEESQFERQFSETNEKIEALTHKLSILQFMVDDHQKTLKQMEAALEAGTMDTPKPDASPEPVPQLPSGQVLSPAVEKKTRPVSVNGENADQMYKKALSVYRSGSYGEAAMLFNLITENYPGHKLADNALYWSGECFYAQKNYNDSIREFKRVLEKYPNGSKVPDSLLKIGYSYLALGDKANAQSFLTVQEEFGSFDSYIWRFVDGVPIQNQWTSLAEIPASTPLSDTVSKDLKQRGFKFVGSTIVYAHMQATGMVNDHVINCFRHREVARLG